MSEPSDDGYTSEPTHLRIYREETGDEYVWHVDGADNEGHYTEDVRRFQTFAECYAGADLLVADTTAEGVRWLWDNQRKTPLRRNLGVPLMGTCDRHGGDWGTDETCGNCTDEAGNPLPRP